MEFIFIAALLVGAPERGIDADTLDLAGTRIRLWGVQAPERRDYCQRAEQAAFRCDDVGRDFVIRLSADGLTCEPLDIDRYGRTVARCVTADGRDISRALVRAGYAMTYRRFSRDYVTDENDARLAGIGWWNCDVIAPDSWQRRKKC